MQPEQTVQPVQTVQPIPMQQMPTWQARMRLLWERPRPRAACR
jgi:hypothetical protein